MAVAGDRDPLDLERDALVSLVAWSVGLERFQTLTLSEALDTRVAHPRRGAAVVARRGARATRPRREPAQQRARERTLMLIHLLSVAAPAVRVDVVDFLARRREERTPDDVAAVAALMREHGSLAFARSFGQGIAEAATEAFDVAFASVPDSEKRRFVHDLIGWMLDRAA